MKIAKAVLAAMVLALPALASEPPLVCRPYAEQVVVAQYELNDFVRLVIEPLREQKYKLEQELDFKLNEPKRLRVRAGEIRKEVRQLEVRKTTLPMDIQDLRTRSAARLSDADQAQAEAELLPPGPSRKAKLERAVELRKRARELTVEANNKEKQLIAIESQIDAKNTRAAQLDSRATEIETSVPTVADLREAIAAFEMRLADETNLRREKERELYEARTVNQMCVEHEGLKAAYSAIQNTVLSIRVGGCGISLPMPQSDGEYRGQVDGRRIMCQ